MNKWLTFSVLESKHHKSFAALELEDSQIAGPDAGPWRVIHIFRVHVDRLDEVLSKWREINHPQEKAKEEV